MKKYRLIVNRKSNFLIDDEINRFLFYRENKKGIDNFQIGNDRIIILFRMKERYKCEFTNLLNTLGIKDYSLENSIIC